MTVFDLQAILRLDKSQYEQGLTDAENSSGSFGTKLAKSLGTLTQTVAVAAAAASAAVGKVAYDAIQGYANYEQLIGGVETLFKDSADIVSSYADNAYMTAGLSANEYMETVTSFSASLLQSLGGDTVKAAEYADLAITDMSDNANKMGTSMESIQFAYQGFAKQNYTMLDNLKLGYGGTKTEMERLIQDAERLDESFIASRDANDQLTLSYDNVVEAIHIVQENMGIAGTTAKEAATTIEGSVKSMRSAWKNLVSGLGDSEADISKLVSNFTRSLEGAFDNLLPVLENIFNNLAHALPNVLTKIFPKIVSAISNMLPNLVRAVSDLIKGLVKALPDAVSSIVKVLPDLLKDILSGVGDILGSLLPSLAESIGNVLINLPAMLVGTIGGLVDGLVNLVTGVVDAVKKQAEASIPDDLAEGYVGKVKSNFEKSFSDGMLNLKSAVANIIGNTEWSEALDGIRLASELQDKIIADYESVRQQMSEYSFENFQLETEANINTAMTFLGALKGQLDDQGNVVGSLEIVQSYIDKINGILGEGAVTLEETPTDWIVQIIEKYKDSDGNVTSPESIRSEIEAKLNELFGGENAPAIDLNTQTYNAVSEVLSKYTQADALADKDKIRRDIEKALTQAGVPSVTAKAIAKTTVDEGGIETWFGTARSTSWSNSAYIQWLQSKKVLPTVDNPAKVQAVANVLTKLALGEIDKEQFVAELQELKLTQDEIDTVIDYSVNYDQVNEAAEAFKKLRAEQYMAKLTDIFTDAQMENIKNFTTAIDGANKAKEAFADGMTKDEFFSFSDQLNAATMSLNLHEQQARDLNGTYWDLMGASTGFADREEYIQYMLSQDTSYQEHKAQVDALRDSQIEYAQKLYATGQSYSNLNLETKNYLSSAAMQAESVSDVIKLLGLSGEQLELLGPVTQTFFDTFGTGVRNLSSAEISEWYGELEAGSDVLHQALENGVLTQEEASKFLEVLAHSTGLYKETVDSTSESMDNLETSMSDVAGSAKNAADAVDESTEDIVESGAEAVEGFAEKIREGSDDAGKAGSELGKAAIAELDKETMEASRVGHVVASELTSSMISGKPDVVGGADELRSGIEDTISPLGDSMSGYGSEGGSQLNSGFTGWLTTVSMSVALMFGYFSAAFGKGLSSAMNTWGSDAGKSLNSGLRQQLSTVNGAVNSMVSGISNRLSNLKGSAYNAGYNAGQGLYNGLNAWGGSIYNRAWSIANSIAQAMRYALRVHSPSRVMEEIGSYTSEGLYNGLAKWEGTITEKAEGIANNVSEAMQPTINDDWGIGALNNQLAQYNLSASRTNNAMTSMYTLLATYLPQIAHMQVVMDGDKVVGFLMPKFNQQFKDMRTQLDRGGAEFA